MLEALRKQSQSWLIWVALGIIIIVFIFFFGPQAGGFDPSNKQWAAKVRGGKIYNTELEAAIDRAGQITGRDVRGDAYLDVKRDVLLDMTMVHLLADEARSEGLRISDDELSCYIVNWNENYKVDDEYVCRQFSRSYQLQYPNLDYMFYSDPDGNFATDFDQSVRRWFQLSAPAYEDWKERELLAFHYLDILAAGLPVDQASIEGYVNRRADKINLEYVRLAPEDEAEIEVSDAEVLGFLASNRADVQSNYDENVATYTSERQLRLRRIAIRKPGDADSDEYAAAQRNYQEVLEAAQQADADFEQLVQDETDFEQDKENGGDMGLRPQGNVSADLWGAASELDIGAVTGVEQGFAWNIIKLEEDVAAGTTPLSEVEQQIAEDLVRGQKRQRQRDQMVSRGERILAYAKDNNVSLTDAAAAIQPAVAVAPTENEEGGAEQPQTSADNAALEVEETGPFSFEPSPPDLSGIDPQFRQYVQIQARDPRTVPGVGNSPSLVAHVFQLTEEAPLIGDMIEVEGIPYLIRLKERVRGNDEERLQQEISSTLRATLSNEWFSPIRTRIKLVAHNGQPFAPALQDLLNRAIEDGDIEVREKLFEEREQLPESL